MNKYYKHIGAYCVQSYLDKSGKYQMQTGITLAK